ncbi:MAG: phosphoribosylglycinamide formyltransferase [Bifidobacteriaceae bacterium]|nr:phosphoribosylglycinamide formyltransferase [Bifidobacteriaceae bacterium]
MTPSAPTPATSAQSAIDRPFTIVLLASGTGTLAKAIIEAVQDGRLRVRIAALGTDRDAPALDVAKAAGIATFTVKPSDFPDRDAWDRGLLKAVEAFEPDLVASVGFMRVFGPAFLSRFEGLTINSHPALLPKFPGAHAVRDALAAGVTETGCSIHFVDSGVDTGPVIAQRRVPVEPGDDEATLHERIKVQERDMAVQVIGRCASGKILLHPHR